MVSRVNTRCQKQQPYTSSTLGARGKNGDRRRYVRIQGKATEHIATHTHKHTKHYRILICLRGAPRARIFRWCARLVARVVGWVYTLGFWYYSLFFCLYDVCCLWVRTVYFKMPRAWIFYDVLFICLVFYMDSNAVCCCAKIMFER